MLKFQQKSNFCSISQFHLFPDKLLGTGSFGSVTLAVHISTCKLYALKIINLQKIGETQRKLIQKQNKIHGQLDYPHIVKLWGSFVQEKSLYMVMDYVERGSLFYYQNTRAIFPQIEAFKYFHQTLKAVKYLHANNIIHRDIKPENLLIDTDYNIKLCDFGWATQNILQKRTTFCGTYQYMAPQMIFERAYDYKIDIWALGVLLYELLHGFAPFKGQSVNQVKHKMKIGQYSLNSQISEQCKQLIIMILKFQPQDRITIDEVERSKWVGKMQRMLAKHYIQHQNHNINKNTNYIQQNIRNTTEDNTNFNKDTSKFISDKSSSRIYIQNIKQPSSFEEPSNTESTSTNNNHNYNFAKPMGTVDHTQSVMVIGDDYNRDQMENKEKTINVHKTNNEDIQELRRKPNNGKTNKVNLHKKTISATTFIEPDEDIIQLYENKKKKEVKEKSKDKDNQKVKSKLSKVRKQKQILIKNILSPKNHKVSKKKVKNYSQLSHLGNNLAGVSSDNEMKFYFESDISEQHQAEDEIYTKRLKNKNHSTENIHDEFGSGSNINKRCKTLAENDVLLFSKKLYKIDGKVKCQKTEKGETIKDLHYKKRKSQQHIASTLQVLSYNKEGKLTKSKSKSKSKNKYKKTYKDSLTKNHIKNVASQPSLIGFSMKKK